MNGDSDTPKPPKNNVTGQMDQFGAMWRDWGSVVASYFKSLTANGFTREEALVLTREWQSAVVSKIITLGDKK